MLPRLGAAQELFDAFNKSFTNINVEDGLSNNLVYGFAQDSIGFMWVATADGLCRYGGNEFKVFRHDINDPNSIISNNLNDVLYEANSNRIWISTSLGLEILDLETMRFSRLDSIAGVKLSHASVAITQNSKGDVAVAFSNSALLVYDGESYNYYKPERTGSSNAMYISYMGDTSVCVVQHGGHLLIHHLNDRTTERIFIGDDIVLNKPSCYLNRLTLGTNLGLYVFDAEKRQFEPTDNAYLNETDIVASYLDKEGHLWIGTREEGLAISKTPVEDFGPDLQFDYYTPRSDGSSVFSKTIQTFFEDEEGAIWMGTWSSGINYVGPKRASIRLIDGNPRAKVHFSHQRVWGLDYADDILWIGTDGGGLNSLNIKTGEVQRGVLSRFGMSDDLAVLSIHQTADDVLWVGTYKEGLIRLNLKTGARRVYQRNKEHRNTINRNDVRLIFEDSRGRLFIGTNGGGLQIYDAVFERFFSIDEFRGMDVRSICEDQNGGYWISGYSETFFYYHPENREFTKIDANIIREFKGNKISSIRLWGDHLYIGTRYNGLVKFNTLDSTYVIYDENEGLINNSIRALEFDEAGELWIATDRGISVFNVTDKLFQNFGSSYNVQKGEFNVGSVARLPNGRLAFGGTRGLNIVDTENLKANTTNQKPLLTDILILGNSITDLEGRKSPLFAQGPVVLPYDHNVLTFEFETLNYPVAAKQMLHYTLEGSDQQWNVARGADAITYGNLSPGEYTFRIAKTMDGSKVDVKRVELVIEPPIWQTKTAIILYIIVGLGLLLLFVWYYTSQIQLRSSLVYEKKIRFQEHKLNQERIRFFTNFSHELRTPLTLIIGPLKSLIIRAKDDEVREGLKLIQRNALSLSNLINKMLEFRKAEVGNFKLQVSKYDIVEVLDSIISNYRDLAKFRNVTLLFEKPDQELALWVDAEKLEIVMNNLFSNAFKYTPTGGRITVSLTEASDQVTVSVKDTGPGIPKDSIKTIFQWYYQAYDSKSVSGTGIGLALTKKIVELHGGVIKVRNLKNEGADFYFSLPKGKEHLGQMEFVEQRPLTLEIPEYPATQETDELSDQVVDPNDKRERLLIVDDNEDIVSYLKQVLENKYVVYVATNGEKGIALAMEEIPDLIVSDVMMPVKTGIDLCKALKNDSRTSHIPIILLTAKHSTEDTILGYSEGADSYMVKPFDEELLLSRVDNLLKSRVVLKSYFLGQADSEEAETSEDQKKEDSRVQVEMEFLQKIEEVIFKERLETGKDIGVYELARELGFSRASLYRKLKSVTGLSINEFIRKLKLKKAEELISSGKMNVSEAAFFVGFNDVKYFRSIFKKEFNRLPSDVKMDAPKRLL
ncbi:hybrid sensor histidine kinase/response regulator transcription factor [Marinoscillum furvescens]|uniref:histidine kinase n=1 Tax=Marinoscillum furvescens DSM 4134 TaxID=1122208 RepID=A0A3D9L3Y0_MARFU|nr:two-component regulator propeller domain-containing protein [Marinoscillum furvescens]REE00171.1 YXYXY domain-containing protein [Marinoscillum furvescens DSM 4134]